MVAHLHFTQNLSFHNMADNCYSLLARQNFYIDDINIFFIKELNSVNYSDIKLLFEQMKKQYLFEIEKITNRIYAFERSIILLDNKIKILQANIMDHTQIIIDNGCSYFVCVFQVDCKIFRVKLDEYNQSVLYELKKYLAKADERSVRIKAIFELFDGYYVSKRLLKHIHKKTSYKRNLQIDIKNKDAEDDSFDEGDFGGDEESARYITKNSFSVLWDVESVIHPSDVQDIEVDLLNNAVHASSDSLMPVDNASAKSE